MSWTVLGMPSLKHLAYKLVINLLGFSRLVHHSFLPKPVTCWTCHLYHPSTVKIAGTYCSHWLYLPFLSVSATNLYLLHKFLMLVFFCIARSIGKMCIKTLDLWISGKTSIFMASSRYLIIAMNCRIVVIRQISIAFQKLSTGDRKQQET
jgi:hypothetical protein